MEKKKAWSLLLCVLLLLFQQKVFGQTQTKYNAPRSIYGNRDVEIVSTKRVSDGYIILGTLKLNESQANEQNDILLMKTNLDGESGSSYPNTWKWRIHDPNDMGDEQAQGLIIDSKGDIVFMANSKANTACADNAHVTLVVKCDPLTGAIIEKKRIPHMLSKQVIETFDANGDQFGYALGGFKVNCSDREHRGMVVSLNPNLTKKWAKILDDIYYISSLVQKNDGDGIVALSPVNQSYALWTSGALMEFDYVTGALWSNSNGQNIQYLGQQYHSDPNSSSPTATSVYGYNGRMVKSLNGNLIVVQSNTVRDGLGDNINLFSGYEISISEFNTNLELLSYNFSTLSDYASFQLEEVLVSELCGSISYSVMVSGELNNGGINYMNIGLLSFNEDLKFNYGNIIESKVTGLGYDQRGGLPIYIRSSQHGVDRYSHFYRSFDRTLDEGFILSASLSNLSNGSHMYDNKFDIIKTTNSFASGTDCDAELSVIEYCRQKTGLIDGEPSRYPNYNVCFDIRSGVTTASDFEFQSMAVTLNSSQIGVDHHTLHCPKESCEDFNILIDGPEVWCPNALEYTLVLTDGGDYYSVIWTFNGQSIKPTKNDNSYRVDNGPGTYRVSVIGREGCCGFGEIIISPAVDPLAGISIVPFGPFCIGSNLLTYSVPLQLTGIPTVSGTEQWTGPGVVYSGSVASIDYTMPSTTGVQFGQNTIYYEYTDIYNCQWAISYTYTVNQVNVQFGDDIDFCPNSPTMVFTAPTNGYLEIDGIVYNSSYSFDPSTIDQNTHPNGITKTLLVYELNTVTGCNDITERYLHWLPDISLTVNVDLVAANVNPTGGYPWALGPFNWTSGINSWNHFSPYGGFWIGPVFDLPSTQGALFDPPSTGLYDVTYTYIGTNGTIRACQAETVTGIVVNP